MTWTIDLLLLAVFLQTLESFWVTPWDWGIVAAEIPSPFRPWISSYKALLIVRLLALPITLLAPAVGLGLLLLATWGLMLRWRGTFNGGSDAMTMQLLFAAWIGQWFPKGALMYIAVQLVLSYFVAGVAKVSQRDWRRGTALPVFLADVGCQIATPALALSWGLILFELLFPLALWRPWPFVGLGIFFHLINAYVFGLNRFFFAWLAAYPALLLTAGWLR